MQSLKILEIFTEAFYTACFKKIKHPTRDNNHFDTVMYQSETRQTEYERYINLLKTTVFQLRLNDRCVRRYVTANIAKITLQSLKRIQRQV